jgi:hemerythrin-like metal-binding protein
MAFFEWDDSYSVGVDSLDAQHKELIKLINRLDQIEAHGGNLTGVLNRLDWYVRHHFSFEESLMEGAGYPHLKAHIAKHREFEKWLRSSRIAVPAGSGEARDLGKIINDYLKAWLRKHILVVDMDYRATLTAAGNRRGAMAVLVEALIETLEEAGSPPSADELARALALAHDLRFCIDVEAEEPPGGGKP